AIFYDYLIATGNLRSCACAIRDLKDHKGKRQMFNMEVERWIRLTSKHLEYHDDVSKIPFLINMLDLTYPQHREAMRSVKVIFRRFLSSFKDYELKNPVKVAKYDRNHLKDLLASTAHDLDSMQF